MALDLTVTRESDVPVGTQLAWKLKTLIAAGQLSAGERLPGVRELSGAAGVNVNTARSVYRRLEDEGLIRSEHGRGTFVAERPVAGHELARIAATAVAEARTAGLDPRDVAAALFVAGREAPARNPETGGPSKGSSSGSRPPAPDDERQRRRVLRAEIVQLEGELAYLEQLTTSPAPRRGDRAGRLLSAAELEVVRDQLGDRLTVLRHAREQLLRERDERDRRAAQQPGAQPAGRVWHHGGVSTGVRRRAPRVVLTAP